MRLVRIFFVHFCVPFKVIFWVEEWTNLRFSDSVLVFVRGVIWHQAERGINAILCHIRKMTPTATIVNERNLTRPMA